MKRDELDNLLKELTTEDLSVERRLEIFKSIQDDKDSSIATIEDLNTKNAKLVDDYKTLEKKRVDDFFNQGRESQQAQNEFNNNGTPNADSNNSTVSVDSILED